jgi:hypothetical protein
LAQQVFEENPIYKANFLVEAVGKRRMSKLFKSSMRSARRFSELQPYKNSEFYLSQHILEKNYYEMTQHELNRSAKSNVEKILENLDKFYLSEKVRWYTSILTQQFLVSHEYNLLFIDEIIAYLSKMDFEDTPVIAIYHTVFLTIKEPDKDEHYFKLKLLLEEHGLKFPISEIKPIYYSAINFCIRKMLNDKKFMNELLLLYKDLLKKEILYIEDGLSPWDFKNIITVALRLGELEWTEMFIDKYSKFIPEAYRQNAVTFNLAQLYFYQKKYGDLIALLKTVEYEDFSYNLNAKGYLLFTYYEMDEQEPLYSLFESFRTYLNRHKNYPLHRREMYSNLIKYTKKLMGLRVGDKKSLEKLKKDVLETKNLSGKEWLLEKIEELA